MASTSSTIRRNPRVAFRELADGTGVLLHLDSTAYHGINRVGVLIWSLIEDGMTVPRLTEAIRARVVDPPGDLDRDVAEFIEDLNTRDLVVVEPPLLAEP